MVLQAALEHKDLHAHTGSKWSHGIVSTIAGYHAKPRNKYSESKVMPADIFGLKCTSQQWKEWAPRGVRICVGVTSAYIMMGCQMIGQLVG